MNILMKTNKAELAMAVSMQTSTTKRIFEDGKAADGVALGDYSEGYLKTRQKNNWTDSKKIILQATGQMHKDFSVINNGKGLGLGFKNSDNLEKSYLVEATYKKRIFAATDDEVDLSMKLFEKNVKEILNG